MEVELAAVDGPQGAEAGGCPGDVDVVLVVGWRVRVCVGVGRGLLLLLLLLVMMGGVVWGGVVRRPCPLRNPTCWRMHPVLWMVKKEKNKRTTYIAGQTFGVIILFLKEVVVMSPVVLTH